MKCNVEMRMTTARSLGSRDEGSAFFRILKEHVPELLPERYGNYEPLRHKFEGESIEPLLAAWGANSYWKRRKGRVEGILSPGLSQSPGQGSIYTCQQLGVAPQARLLALISALAETFLADFAAIQILTPGEIKRGHGSDSVLFTKSDGTGAFFSVQPIQLRKQYVPDLYWLTIFGPPYVEIFGWERLLSAPAHRVEELPYGGVLLQLTPEITDIEANYFTFLSARNRVKEHLNHDVFFDPQKGADYEYRRPDFENR